MQLQRRRGGARATHQHHLDNVTPCLRTGLTWKEIREERARAEQEGREPVYELHQLALVEGSKRIGVSGICVGRRPAGVSQQVATVLLLAYYQVLQTTC